MIISDGRKIKVQNFGLYPISANRVVLVKGKTVILAEPDDVNITKYPLAIALQPFEIGSWGEVVLSGSLLNVNTSVYSDFNNTILYLGAEGVITATPSNVSIGSISKLSNIEGEIFINFSVSPTVAWGDITGDIVDQTDLQGELDNKQDSITLTTTGNSGPATLSGGALNIPQYTFTGVSVYVKNNTTYSSVSTGSQIIHSLTIPANTFIAGDVLRITARFKKVGANSTSAASIYINNSVSLSGGKIVRSNPFAAGTLANGQQGTVVIINATNLTQLPPTPSSATDIGLSTSAWVDSTAIDWTATQYLLFSCAPNSALDVVSLIYYQVEKL